MYAIRVNQLSIILSYVEILGVDISEDPKINSKCRYLYNESPFDKG